MQTSFMPSVVFKFLAQSLASSFLTKKSLWLNKCFIIITKLITDTLSHTY